MKFLSCCWVLLLALLLTVSVRAQDPVDAGPDETTQVLIEGLFAEDISVSLILDNSRTKAGRDFYEILYRQWNEAASDTLQAKSFMSRLDPDDFVILVEELPFLSRGTGTLISVSINDVPLYQQLLQPRYDLIEESATLAALIIKEYFAGYLEIQQQLENQDLKGTGVF